MRRFGGDSNLVRKTLASTFNLHRRFSMADIDPELATAIKAAKTGKSMYFVLVAKGATDGALLVNKSKIPPAKVNDAKKEAGGGTVIRGRCIGEDGTIVFQTAK